MAGELGPGLLGLLDRVVELALTGDQGGDLARRAGRARPTPSRRRPLGEIGAPVGELVDRRVDALQFEQVVAQHAAIR